MSNRRFGFTLIELLVVIAIIAILAAILFPVFAAARKKAQASTCLSNVKQLSLSVLMYCQDVDGNLPIYQYYSYLVWGTCTPPKYIDWAVEIYPYVKSPQVYGCPSDNLADDGSRGAGDYNDDLACFSNPIDPNSYGFNYFQVGKSLVNIQEPAQCFMLGDCLEGMPSWPNPTGPLIFCGPVASEFVGNNNLAIRHAGGANVAFMDGHVTWLNPTNSTTVPVGTNYYTAPVSPDYFWLGQ
jgi:prepilin-type N-terminal cleavage/methylation domain-containing protein/prepilin-type processing-associated H-X9-DG protein